MKKVIVAITGASAVLYGIRFLKELRKLPEVQVTLVMSRSAELNIELETNYLPEQVRALADFCYEDDCLSAPIASGSYRTDAMVIVPCSMKTLSAISHGYSETLIVRAADTILKEGRRLVICPRETPLNVIHLENMLLLARMGVGIIPPMPAFYHRPETIDDLIRHHCMKIMDYLDLPFDSVSRWTGSDCKETDMN